MDAPFLIYFAVPDNYTIGTVFTRYEDALQYALGQVQPIRDCPGSFTRAFVDVRESDTQGDRLIARYEVMPS